MRTGQESTSLKQVVQCSGGAVVVVVAVVAAVDVVVVLVVVVVVVVQVGLISAALTNQHP